MNINIPKVFLEHSDHRGNLIYIPYLRGFCCDVCGKLSIFTDEWFANMSPNTTSPIFGLSFIGRKEYMKGKFGIFGKDAKAFIRALKKCWFESPEKLRKHEKYLRRYRNRAAKSQ